jgi:hypothetical protein
MGWEWIQNGDKREKKKRNGKGRGRDGREGGNSTNADVYGLRLNQQQVYKTQGSGFSSLAYRRRSGEIEQALTKLNVGSGRVLDPPQTAPTHSNWR